MKIKILGKTAILESSLKLKDIEEIGKLDKSALQLTREEDGVQVPYFKISAGQIPSICKYGICFTEENFDGSAMISVRIEYAETPEEVKEEVVNLFMNAAENLKELEQIVPARLAEIKAKRDEFISSIIFG